MIRTHLRVYTYTHTHLNRGLTGVTGQEWRARRTPAQTGPKCTRGRRYHHHAREDAFLPALLEARHCRSLLCWHSLAPPSLISPHPPTCATCLSQYRRCLHPTCPGLRRLLLSVREDRAGLQDLGGVSGFSVPWAASAPAATQCHVRPALNHILYQSALHTSPVLT